MEKTTKPTADAKDDQFQQLEKGKKASKHMARLYKTRGTQLEGQIVQKIPTEQKSPVVLTT